jgi:LacI family transcriptional regulator
MIAKKSVTIKEVAHAAGVSAQTVSRVLNDRPDVSEETRQRVRALISEMGYSPNIIARSLIQGRSHTIGVVGYGLGYYGPSRTLTGVERQANELGYTPLLSLLREPEDNAGESALPNLLSRKVDGIIWAVPEIGSHRAALLEATRHIPVPIIFINMQPRPDLAVVAVDNYNGGRQAALHLLARGCRKVAVITGPETWWESFQREAGWRSAMLDSGRVSEPELAQLRVTGDWYPASGDRGLEQLLRRDPSIDAVFAFNDPMALGVLKAAQRLGCRVPDDLAVVGFDDTPEASYFNPALSTVRQPLVEMGAQAVRLLHRMLSQRESESIHPEQIWLQPELVVRASSMR